MSTLDQTFLAVIRDKNFMSEGEVQLVIMKGEASSLIRQLHTYCSFSGRADIFTFEPQPEVPHERKGYDGLRQLGTVLKHYGTTDNVGDYSHYAIGIFACIKRLPNTQQPYELKELIKRAEEELASCVKREEINGPEVSTPGGEG